MPRNTSDPKSEFERAVAAQQSQGMSRAEATRAAVRKFPKLHRDYLRQANGSRPEAAKRIRK